MGTWEHVLPLFVPGYTVLFPTCSDNVLNVPLCGYTCTRILYPVTNSVPTYLRLERPRRRGRSKRPGTLFVTGYNMRVHTANCYPTFPTFDAPNKSQLFFLFPRGYMRVPVYPTYPVAKGILWSIILNGGCVLGVVQSWTSAQPQEEVASAPEEGDLKAYITMVLGKEVVSKCATIWRKKPGEVCQYHEHMAGLWEDNQPHLVGREQECQWSTPPPPAQYTPGVY